MGFWTDSLGNRKPLYTEKGLSWGTADAYGHPFEHINYTPNETVNLGHKVEPEKKYKAKVDIPKESHRNSKYNEGVSQPFSKTPAKDYDGTFGDGRKGFWQKMLDNNKVDYIQPLPTEGMQSWGNAPIYNRPFVHNEDGSISTTYGGIAGDESEGGYRVFTGISPDGQFYDNPDMRAMSTGDNVVATFDSLPNAENFENAWHDREEQRLQYENDPWKLAQYVHDMELADHPERFNPNGISYTKLWSSMLRR